MNHPLPRQPARPAAAPLPWPGRLQLPPLLCAGVLGAGLLGGALLAMPAPLPVPGARQAATGHTVPASPGQAPITPITATTARPGSPPPDAARHGSAADEGSADWLAATQAFQAGQHAAAFGRFAGLAQAGDAEAARIALFMLDHGHRLYGQDWGTTPAEHRRWQQMARQAQAGAPDNGHSGE
ncbi:hypothetical protein [Aquabacterium sp. OR-4]|uniref:hypothetical protein n=1 Tax=Aquabacterium sp. OR-4 TaxID=2978127 RepID=UPI0028C799D4|nr:hypothetical protein [Aquabacterium sp. OR-4]MDT7837999.1 hypothetical protein [Aquabacterium sp. OR-4]